MYNNSLDKFDVKEYMSHVDIVYGFLEVLEKNDALSKEAIAKSRKLLDNVINVVYADYIKNENKKGRKPGRPPGRSNKKNATESKIIYLT